jgi:hypothetical protein
MPSSCGAPTASSSSTSSTSRRSRSPRRAARTPDGRGGHERSLCSTRTKSRLAPLGRIYGRTPCEGLCS